MRTMILAAAGLAVAAPLSAQTQSGTYQSNDGRTYQSNDGRTYQGSDGRTYPCKKSNGTTGTVAGAVGGGLIGHALGGGTLGTLAGAGGGALLGRHIDKKHDAAQNRKNGC